MDKTGHTILIGKFEKDNGVYYSNEYYKQPRHRKKVVIYSSEKKDNGVINKPDYNALEYIKCPSITKIENKGE